MDLLQHSGQLYDGWLGLCVPSEAACGVLQIGGPLGHWRRRDPKEEAPTSRRMKYTYFPSEAESRSLGQLLARFLHIPAAGPQASQIHAPA